MRTFILAVAGLALSVAACSSYGTSVVEVNKTRAAVSLVSISLPRSLEQGKTARGVATVKDANGAVLTDRSVSWFTSSAAVAGVDDSGEVTAVAPGTAILTATSEGVAGQATMSVLGAPPTPTPVASVQVAIAPASVLVGAKAVATATLRDSSGNTLGGRNVTWQSSDARVASVVATGEVTAIAAGTATISAVSEGQTGLATLTVSVPPPIPVASIAVSPTSVAIAVSGTSQLSATTRDANNNVLTGRTVVWSSANASIASVSSSGLVTAVAAGTVQVSAASEGKSASATITVNAPAPPPVSSVSVSPSSSSLQVGDTLRLSAVTRDASGTVLTGRTIAWSTNNGGVATVSATGLVSAVATGTASVTATSEGKSASATINVSAAAPPPPPPPPPPSGIWRSNEPAGLTPISDQPFSSMPSNGWRMQNSSSIVADNSGPQSPGSILDVHYAVGLAGGFAPGQAWDLLPTPVNTLYYAVWMKFSANWVGHPSLVNKTLFISLNDQNLLFIAGYGAGSDPLLCSIGLQSIQNLGVSSFWHPNLVPNAHFTRGQWDLLELVVKSNTSGNADGSVDVYLNGVHITSRPGIQWTSGGSNINQASISPVWGGEGAVLGTAMDLQFDHAYLSGKQ